jgi:hypothetical protein
VEIFQPFSNLSDFLGQNSAKNLSGIRSQKAWPAIEQFSSLKEIGAIVPVGKNRFGQKGIGGI